jgi:hypothetical protein
MATMAQIPFTSVDSSRKFVAGRIVNAFGFSRRLLEHFENGMMERQAAGFRKAADTLARIDLRPKKRLRRINISHPGYFSLIEQK